MQVNIGNIVKTHIKEESEQYTLTRLVSSSGEWAPGSYVVDMVSFATVSSKTRVQDHKLSTIVF